MPRRSSAKRSASAGRASRPARKPAPQPVHHHAPVHKSESTIGIADGLKFGIGNAIANRFVDSIMGASRIRHETVVPAAQTAPTAPQAPTAPTPLTTPTPTPTPTMGAYDACSLPIQSFQDCLSSNADEIGKCQFYMDMLAECRKNSASMLTS